MGGARWDGDTRGTGVGSAAEFGPAIAELHRLAQFPDWVAEDAEAHLGVHLRAAAAGMDVTFRTGTAGPDGVYRAVITSDPRIAGNRRALRALGWQLLGAIAEASTHVLETPLDGGLELRMVTGMPPATTSFADHGHTVVLVLLWQQGRPSS